MKTSNEVKNIFAAIIKAAPELPNVQPDKENPYFKSEYASLAHILTIVKPVLAKHGLAIIQTSTGTEIETTLLHTSGEWIASTLPISAAPGAKAQEVGSAISYARRYSIAAILNIATDTDDDGNAASKPVEKPVKAEKPTPEQKKDFAKDANPKRKALIKQIGEYTTHLTAQEKESLRGAIKRAETDKDLESLLDTTKAIHDEREGIAKEAIY